MGHRRSHTWCSTDVRTFAKSTNSPMMWADADVGFPEFPGSAPATDQMTSAALLRKGGLTETPRLGHKLDHIWSMG